MTRPGDGVWRGGPPPAWSGFRRLAVTAVDHTCEIRVISGAVDYQPDPVESAADGNLLLCCARPTTELALDL